MQRWVGWRVYGPEPVVNSIVSVEDRVGFRMGEGYVCLRRGGGGRGGGQRRR